MFVSYRTGLFVTWIFESMFLNELSKKTSERFEFSQNAAGFFIVVAAFSLMLDNIQSKPA